MSLQMANDITMLPQVLKVQRCGATSDHKNYRRPVNNKKLRPGKQAGSCYEQANDQRKKQPKKVIAFSYSSLNENHLSGCLIQ